jgi:hypothetical protein
MIIDGSAPIAGGGMPPMQDRWGRGYVLPPRHKRTVGAFYWNRRITHTPVYAKPATVSLACGVLIDLEAPRTEIEDTTIADHRWALVLVAPTAGRRHVAAGRAPMSTLTPLKKRCPKSLISMKSHTEGMKWVIGY